MNKCLACGHKAHVGDCEFGIGWSNGAVQMVEPCGCNVTGYTSEPSLNLLREEWNFLVVNAQHRFAGKPREELINKIKDLAAYCLKFTHGVVAGGTEDDLSKIPAGELRYRVTHNLKDSIKCLDELERREAKLFEMHDDTERGSDA